MKQLLFVCVFLVVSIISKETDMNVDSVLLSFNYECVENKFDNTFSISHNDNELLFYNDYDTTTISYTMIVTETDTLMALSIMTFESSIYQYDYIRMIIHDDVIEGELYNVTESLDRNLIQNIYTAYGKHLRVYMIYMDYMDFGELSTIEISNKLFGKFVIQETLDTVHIDFDEYLRALDFLK